MHPWLFWYHILMFYAYLVNHMTFVSWPPISVSQPAPQVGLLIPHISRFVLNPKQADLHPPSAFQHKNKHRAPLLPEGMVLGTPTVQLIPLRGVLAALSECGEALSGQRLLFWITCREGGRAEFAAGAWRRDERGYGRESPCLQGGQGWMRVTTRMEAFAKSSLELTMWPVEGQARKEIEVNSVVTY